MSDIGAIAPGRWHVWHARWKIGATSRVNVTSSPAVCPAAIAGAATTAARTASPSARDDTDPTRRTPPAKVTPVAMSMAPSLDSLECTTR